MSYRFVARAPAQGVTRPVVIGFGPCGLFAALVLAQMGFRPIVLERGKVVRERTKDTWGLWRRGVLDPESNVQFGEGGAGTFSDGKLYSQIKDPRHHGRKVLDRVRRGRRAGGNSLRRQAAHRHVPAGQHGREDARARSRRSAARTASTAASTTSRSMSAATACATSAASCSPTARTFATDHVVLALGHSARDTFEMLSRRGVAMEAKPFSIGFRIEHPQSLIDRAASASAGNRARRRRLQARASRAATAARSTASACARAAPWWRRPPSRAASSPTA